ncbi:ABC transporter G family member 15 [Vanrija pseudolonga]|uniref:ABC transporter G family member 15 n=1 Tax=Vanrija pseudolonga TaxID=143232 RepID=A0AAF0YMR2_9TREE|nr:ABC transporter G family member 15 [Vanrija pseudolonga]
MRSLDPGKTALMGVLAAGEDEGEIVGHVLLNGRELPLSLQRATGYPPPILRQRKLAYVDEIIDHLELQDIKDAIIGVSGDVLVSSVSLIGVELVSRPTILFLDKPASRLDGQSSLMSVGLL